MGKTHPPIGKKRPNEERLGSDSWKICHLLLVILEGKGGEVEKVAFGNVLTCVDCFALSSSVKMEVGSIS